MAAWLSLAGVGNNQDPRSSSKYFIKNPFIRMLKAPKMKGTVAVAVFVNARTSIKLNFDAILERNLISMSKISIAFSISFYFSALSLFLMHLICTCFPRGLCSLPCMNSKPFPLQKRLFLISCTPLELSTARAMVLPERNWY